MSMSLLVQSSPIEPKHLNAWQAILMFEFAIQGNIQSRTWYCYRFCLRNNAT